MARRAALIVFAVIALLPSLTYAQRTSQFGIKGGMNVSSFHDRSGSVGSARLGYHAGLYYRSHIGNIITLRPEIFYSLEGTVLESTNQRQYTYVGHRSTTTVHKLSVPVLVEIGGKVTLDLGAQLGLLLAADSEINNPQPPPTQNYRNMDDDLAWGDFSVVGGIGFHPGRHFEATIRYNYGLSRVFKASAFPQLPARQSDFRSGVLQATIGYAF